MAPAPADCRAVVPEDGRSQALFTEPLPTVLGPANDRRPPHLQLLIDRTRRIETRPGHRSGWVGRLRSAAPAGLAPAPRNEHRTADARPSSSQVGAPGVVPRRRRPPSSDRLSAAWTLWVLGYACPEPAFRGGVNRDNSRSPSKYPNDSRRRRSRPGFRQLNRRSERRATPAEANERRRAQSIVARPIATDALAGDRSGTASNAVTAPVERPHRDDEGALYLLHRFGTLDGGTEAQLRDEGRRSMQASQIRFPVKVSLTKDSSSSTNELMSGST